MPRILFAALACISLSTQFVLGSPVQLIQGLPGSYTPGQPIAFDVLLPNINNLGSYNIDLVLESSTGTAGVDFFFDLAATVPAAANYVFPTTANYFDSVTVDSATRDRITLTDFEFSGVNVAVGTNDRIANVVFRTLSTFHGPLTVSVDAPLLILDTPDEIPTPVQGFTTLQGDIAAAGAILLSEVPEPSSFLLSAATLLTVWLPIRLGKRRFSNG